VILATAEDCGILETVRRSGVGTSQCGVFAAWGAPQANNQIVQGNQQQIQLVYSNRTVTTNGRVVTAISK
jgi:hypothetical protein